jgi:hypothetical protein
VRFLSGEFLLHGKANGGTIVFARACWVAFLGFLFTIITREILHPDAVLGLSIRAVREAVYDAIPVAGAFFAGAYVALYARFASQWTYLAGVYNQIMAARLRAVDGADGQTTLNRWQAGFIADAVELHLAFKPMFAAVILAMLEREGVRSEYRDANGESETVQLESRLRKLLKIEARPQVAPKAEPPDAPVV